MLNSNNVQKRELVIYINNYDKLPILCEDYIIKEKYIFYYDKHTLVGELQGFLASNMYGYDPDSKNSENYVNWFYIGTGSEAWLVKEDYNLMKFLNQFNLRSLLVHSVYCTGGGGFLEEINASVYINSNEGSHKYTPHVHVYRGIGKHGECSRIALRDLTYMEGKTLRELFSKKDEKIILELLAANKEKLIKYYEDSQNGRIVKPIYLDFNNKEVYFG